MPQSNKNPDARLADLANLVERAHVQASNADPLVAVLFIDHARACNREAEQLRRDLQMRAEERACFPPLAD